MNGSLLMSGFALVGFIGFESLKVYKRLWAGLAPIPERRIEYFSVLVPVGLFVAGTAFAMDLDTAMKAIFMGFSVPASVKAVFDPVAKDGSASSSTTSLEQDRVEDIHVTKTPTIIRDQEPKSIYNIIRYYVSA
jgi:hypothetical protein